MRSVTSFGLCVLALSALLGGCVAGSGDIDSTDDDSAVDGEDVGEAGEALVGCTGESCNGQDPGAMGCEADAVTVASSSIFSPSFAVVGTIAIRRSAACNAVWARASTASGTAYIQAGITRNSPNFGASSASVAPVSAQRSQMVGRLTGSTYTATGYTGPSFGYYPNQGQVSKTF